MTSAVASGYGCNATVDWRLDEQVRGQMGGGRSGGSQVRGWMGGGRCGGRLKKVWKGAGGAVGGSFCICTVHQFSLMLLTQPNQVYPGQLCLCEQITTHVTRMAHACAAFVPSDGERWADR